MAVESHLNPMPSVDVAADLEKLLAETSAAAELDSAHQAVRKQEFLGAGEVFSHVFGGSEGDDVSDLINQNILLD